jgi:hypothetical protein
MLGSGQDQYAVADGADRPAQRLELGDLVAQHTAAKVLAQAGRIATGEDQSVVVFRRYMTPPDR